MQVREIMSYSPSCTTARATAQAAAELMRRTDLGFLPVVDDPESGRVVGVVTDRDLCMQVVAANSSAAALVAECMTPNPVCCHPEDDVKTALARMQRNGVRRLPVVDTHQTIQGVIALSDLIHHVAANARDVYVTLSRITEPRAVSPQAEAAGRRR
jgi:CBS domain-containing protein